MGTAKYLLRTAWNEAGAVARIFTVISVGVPAFLSAAAPVIGEVLFPWWVWATIAVIAPILFVLVSIARHAMRLEEKLRPAIRVDFSFDSLGHVSEGILKVSKDGAMRSVPTKWIRCRVSSATDGHLKNCRAQFTRVQKLEGNVFKDIYAQRLDRPWAIGDASPKDINPDIEYFFDVVYTTDRHSGWGLADPAPLALSQLLAQPGTYRFAIAVSADDVPTKKIALKAEWRSYADFSVTEDSNS